MMQIIGTVGYDTIVTSQAQFNNIVERVGANQYKIKDNYRSVYFKYLLGGYAMAGAGSFLSGGDTWGYLQTNNCGTIICEAGCYFNVSGVQSYIQVNTDSALIFGAYIKGDGATTIGASYGFYMANTAINATLINCRVAYRKVGGNFSGFYCTNHVNDRTMRFIGCSMDTMDIDGAITLTGFYRCWNMDNVIIREITNTGTAGNLTGFYYCRNINNVKIYNTITKNIVILFEYCINVSNGYIINIDNTGNVLEIFNRIRGVTNFHIEDITSNNNIVIFNGDGTTNLNIQISNIYIYSVVSTGGTVYGADYAFEISNVQMYTMSSSANNVIGFYRSGYISNCRADTLAHNGAVGGMSAYGFYSCSLISQSAAITITTNGGGATAEGFKSCSNGSALTTNCAANAGNNYMDSADAAIANKYSIADIFT